MTKRLILMRHAKSDWSHDLDDHERPLNKRGRQSTYALRDWLGLNDYRPDQVLCSSAERTHETLFRLDIKAETTYLRELYLADAASLLAVLKKATGDCVLMVAHNPGIAWFASQAVSTPPEHSRFDDYPTGATLIVNFDVDDWEDVRLGSGTVSDFVIPRDLTDA